MVMDVLGPINTDTHMNVMTYENIEPIVVNQCAICLHTVYQWTRHVAIEQFYRRTEPLLTIKERFAGMPNHVHGRLQEVFTLCKDIGKALQDGLRKLVIVCSVWQVTVTTVQVTSRSCLDDQEMKAIVYHLLLTRQLRRMSKVVSSRV